MLVLAPSLPLSWHSTVHLAAACTRSHCPQPVWHRCKATVCSRISSPTHTLSLARGAIFEVVIQPEAGFDDLCGSFPVQDIL